MRSELRHASTAAARDFQNRFANRQGFKASPPKEDHDDFQGMSQTEETASSEWTVHKVQTFPDKWKYSPEDFKRSDESSVC